MIEEETRMKTCLEYKDEKSNKFWEIEVNNNSHTVRYGKIGTDGTSKTKEFDSNEDAMKDAEKLIASKKKKGYVEAEKSKSVEKPEKKSASSKSKSSAISDEDKALLKKLKSAVKILTSGLYDRYNHEAETAVKKIIRAGKLPRGIEGAQVETLFKNFLLQSKYISVDIPFEYFQELVNAYSFTLQNDPYDIQKEICAFFFYHEKSSGSEISYSVSEISYNEYLDALEYVRTCRSDDFYKLPDDYFLDYSKKSHIQKRALHFLKTYSGNASVYDFFLILLCLVNSAEAKSIAASHIDSMINDYPKGVELQNFYYAVENRFDNNPLFLEYKKKVEERFIVHAKDSESFKFLCAAAGQELSPLDFYSIEFRITNRNASDFSGDYRILMEVKNTRWEMKVESSSKLNLYQSDGTVFEDLVEAKLPTTPASPFDIFEIIQVLQNKLNIEFELRDASVYSTSISKSEKTILEWFVSECKKRGLIPGFDQMIKERYEKQKKLAIGKIEDKNLRLQILSALKSSSIIYFDFDADFLNVYERKRSKKDDKVILKELEQYYITTPVHDDNLKELEKLTTISIHWVKDEIEKKPDFDNPEYQWDYFDITSLKGIEVLSSLKELVLESYRAKISDLTPLTHLKKLETVSLGTSKSEEADLSPLLELESLKKLTIEKYYTENRQKTESIIGKLQEKGVTVEITIEEADHIAPVTDVSPDEALKTGITLMEKALTDEALPYLEKALALESAESYFEYGRLKFRMKLYSEAAGFFEKSIQIDDSRFNPLAYLGDCYLETGEYGKAIASYEQALALKPDEYQELKNIAYCFYKTGDFKNAVYYGRKAVENYKTASSLSSLVLYLYNAGMEDESYQTLDELVFNVDSSAKEKIIQDDDFSKLRNNKIIKGILNGMRYTLLQRGVTVPEFAYNIIFEDDAADGHAFGLPKGITAAMWPRSRGNGIPMRHLFTVKIPEEYRCRGKEITALSVFQGYDGDGGADTIDNVEKYLSDTLPLTEIEMQTEAQKKFWNGLILYKESRHPNEVLFEDIIGTSWAVLYLTEAEFQSVECPLPDFDDTLFDGDEDVEGWFNRQKGPQNLKVEVRENDPNAGKVIADNRNPAEGDYIPPFSTQGEELNLERFYYFQHFGGTSFPGNVNEAEGFGPFYIEFDETLGGANLGGDGVCQIDLLSDKLDWQCG
jgi:predicted DNA-binding WGR domain protein/Flp pilus assembly protein TadD